MNTSTLQKQLSRVGVKFAVKPQELYIKSVRMTMGDARRMNGEGVVFTTTVGLRARNDSDFLPAGKRKTGTDGGVLARPPQDW